MKTVKERRNCRSYTFPLYVSGHYIFLITSLGKRTVGRHAAWPGSRLVTQTTVRFPRERQVAVVTL